MATPEESMCKLNDQVAEAKLTLGVMHYCNVLYVRIPAVSTKDPASAAKARAGLVRELQKKLKKAKVELPAALSARISHM